MKRTTRCEGHYRPCNNKATYLVSGTHQRDEWCACEDCATDAQFETTATIEPVEFD